MRLVARALSVALVAAALAWPRAASAHDHWLEAEPFWNQTPGREKIYLFVGDALEGAQPYVVKSRAHYTRFVVASKAGRRDVLSDMREDATPLALLTSGQSTGSFVVALDAAPRTLELDAKKFGAYLLEERLIDVLLDRAQKAKEDAPGRERYTRYMKAIVQIGDKPDATPTQALGQELEIVPDTNPYAVPRGAELGVRVLFQGKPLAGRAVTAVNRFRGETSRQTVRLDSKGHAAFTLGKPGDWMIRLVHMEPSATPDVDWRSYWSNVTFSLPDATPAPAPRR
ncbi:MAG TPA: DUF4198 domain-containing protein [Byssovorax sp.]